MRQFLAELGADLGPTIPPLQTSLVMEAGSPNSSHLFVSLATSGLNPHCPQCCTSTQKQPTSEGLVCVNPVPSTLPTPVSPKLRVDLVAESKDRVHTGTSREHKGPSQSWPRATGLGLSKQKLG